MFEKAEENADTAPNAFAFGQRLPFNACAVTDNFSSGMHVDSDAGWTVVYRMESERGIVGGEFLFPMMGGCIQAPTWGNLHVQS